MYVYGQNHLASGNGFTAQLAQAVVAESYSGWEQTVWDKVLQRGSAGQIVIEGLAGAKAHTTTVL